MCLVRPAFLYLNVHVLKVFYEQINYYYYTTTHTTTTTTLLVTQKQAGEDLTNKLYVSN